MGFSGLFGTIGLIATIFVVPGIILAIVFGRKK